MPLTESVSFKATLQKGNRIQIPKLIRWQFKMETLQVLKVSVEPVGSFGNEETFYARMSRDGRITIPKLTLKLLQEDAEESLVGSALKVEIEPCKQVEDVKRQLKDERGRSDRRIMRTR